MSETPKFHLLMEGFADGEGFQEIVLTKRNKWRRRKVFTKAEAKAIQDHLATLALPGWGEGKNRSEPW